MTGRFQQTVHDCLSDTRRLKAFRIDFPHIQFVTFPQDLVQMIVKKAYGMAKQMNIPVLGIVENYSYVKCPDCGKEIKVFGESHIDEIAADLNVPVLGKMPLDPAIAQMVEEEKFSEAENPYLEGFEL